MLKNLGCTRLLVSAAYMPIENERILVQCKYIKKHICVLLSINMCFMERKMILATNLLAGAWLGHLSEWYMFILLIQPQSNSLDPDGAIYLDRFFFFFTMTSRNENKPK